MTIMAVTSHATGDGTTDADEFLADARRAALHTLNKQKLLKDKRKQRRVSLRAINETDAGAP
jgi:hypothetical protein